MGHPSSSPQGCIMDQKTGAEIEKETDQLLEGRARESLAAPGEGAAALCGKGRQRNKMAQAGAAGGLPGMNARMWWVGTLQASTS